MVGALLFELVVLKAVQDSQFSKPSNLAASSRIPRGEGYKHCLDAESVADKYYKLFFVRNMQPNSRLGIIAAKRNLPKAVDRNRAKRIVRNLFRCHEIKQRGIDIVVMVRSVTPQDSSLLREALKKLFNRVDNRCAES